MSNEPTDASGVIEAVLEKYADELVELRRDLHAHPELSWPEKRTTDVVADRLDRGRPRGHALLDGSGLIAELGDERAGRRAARRPRRAAGRRHHRRPVGQHRRPASPTPAGTTCTPPRCVGAGARARRGPRAAGLLPGRVRLLFQPAEEVMPGGALQPDAAGALDDVARIFVLHCDPTSTSARSGCATAR